LIRQWFLRRDTRRAPKATENKDKLELISIKNFCASKETIKKVEGQLTEENICKSYI
jgi:hypothetical protein